jgi:hypothetical protein
MFRQSSNMADAPDVFRTESTAVSEEERLSVLENRTLMIVSGRKERKELKALRESTLNLHSLLALS